MQGVESKAKGMQAQCCLLLPLAPLIPPAAPNEVGSWGLSSVPQGISIKQTRAA